MKELFEQVRSANKILACTDPAKVAYVSEAREAYTAEAAKIDEELNFIGHPEETKLDFLIAAVTKESMNEEEFFVIWNALGIIDLAYTDC